MECSAEGCSFDARFSTTGLCLVCQSLLSSGIALPDAAGYNVPGNTKYSSDRPLDVLVRSLKDPVGVTVDGPSWGITYDGTYGVAKDGNGTLYLTNDMSTALYPLYYDGDHLPYIVDEGAKRIIAFTKVGNDTVPSILYAVDAFSGKDGAALSSLWTTSNNGQGGTVTLQGGKAVLAPTDTSYGFGSTAFLSGVKGVSDLEFTCDYSLSSLDEQYPTIGLRSLSPEVWNGGGGGSLPKTGYFFLLMPSNSAIQLQQGYQAGTVVDSVPFTFTSKDMKVRAGTSGKNIQLKIWNADEPEPADWTYNKPQAFSEASGTVVFTTANGAAPVSKPVTIDNFAMTTRAYDIKGTVPAPIGDHEEFFQTFVENFDTPAAANGPFARTYANSWQPYRDEGIYFPGSQVSAHDGVLDCFMSGTKGAAGSFGRPDNYFDHVGGKFSMRAKVLGARGNGAAVMVWPSSDVWDEGEIDYPESNFEDSPMVHHHVMNRGDNRDNYEYFTGASWRDWHVYSVEWIPGVEVRYFLDDVLVFTVNQDVPSAPHRFMFQVGNYGDPGHLYIDWVSIYGWNAPE